MESEMIERARLVSRQISGDGDTGQLETDLGAIHGVRDVEVDPSTHSVTVTYDPNVVDLNGILEVMQDNGYPVDTNS